MKKSTKRCLILMLVVAIVAMTMVFVSAANNSPTYQCFSSTCKDPETGAGKWVTGHLGEKVEAQCEAMGFTWVLCDNCNAKVSQIDWEDALGHDYILRDYTLDEGGKYYQKNLCCSRTDCKYGLNEDRPETDESHAETKYCKVSFINDFVADTYEDKAVYFATLAKTYKKDIITDYVKYPATGSIAVSVEETPVRIADVTFGGYTFAGWLSEEEIASASYDTAGILIANRTYNSEKQAFEYETDTDYAPLVNKAKAYKPAVSTDTPADYNLHAIFEVSMNVIHTLTFVNYDGTYITSVKAPHSLNTVFYSGNVPRKPDNIEYYYTFNYWSLPNSETMVSSKMDVLPPLYSDLTVMAHYYQEAREYNFKYYYYDKDNNLVPYYDGTNYDDIVTCVGTRNVGVNGNKIKVERTFDSKYIYEHKDNMWEIPSRGGWVVDLNDVRLPEGTLDNREIDQIVLVPHYQRYLRTYELVVKVLYEEDPGTYHPEKLTIEVRDDTGKGIAYKDVVYKKADQEKGIAFQTTFDVNYSSRYSVTVTSDGFSGTQDNAFYEGYPDVAEDDRPRDITVTLTKNAATPCGCLCHTFIKPIWVGVLNLLNSLFGAEPVCCDDMFANIGTLLNYGPAKK